eukprot:490520-Pyramimonas_sp.AAC.1
MEVGMHGPCQTGERICLGSGCTPGSSLSHTRRPQGKPSANPSQSAQSVPGGRARQSSGGAWFRPQNAP